MKIEPLSPNRYARRLKAFVGDLPYRTRPYSKRNWGHPFHSLCSYQGKLKPAIAHFLVKEFTSPGETILDPFSGVGTIPFEACQQGRIGIGVDINPIGYHNTFAKVGGVEKSKVIAYADHLEKHLSEDNIQPTAIEEVNIGVNRPIQEYYHPDTFVEILKARRFFLERKDQRDPNLSFLLAALLHLLHGNRPYALSRRSHSITPLAPNGPFEYRPLMPRLRAKIDRMFSEPLLDTFRAGEAYEDSIFRFRLAVPVDCILTSPPFLQSTRFYSSNWLRLWFCGWEYEKQLAMRGEFLEEQQRRSMSIYDTVLRAFDQFIKPGGLCILHLGATRKSSMGQQILNYVAVNGFHPLALETENIEGWESFGIKDQGSTVKHEFLLLQKRNNLLREKLAARIADLVHKLF